MNRAARDAGIVVLLDGQGADELFGGYPWMVGTAAVAGGPTGMARAVRAGGSRRASAVRMLVGAHLPEPLARAYRRRSASPYASAGVVAQTLDVAPPVPDFATGSAMRRELVLQTFVTSLPTLLRYADRSSMAHSREVRLPYLDRRVAEFAFSLPASFLCRDGRNQAHPARRRARASCRRPSSPGATRSRLSRPQARGSPNRAWRERIGEVLLDPSTRARGLYDTAAIEADLRAGAWRDHQALWRAFCAETWRAAFARDSMRSASAVSLG